MGSEHYCLRWNNHQSNLLGVFSQLLQDEALVDVTLACEGHSLRAHKVVLSACSAYFHGLFAAHPDRHPIVILHDAKFSELRTLVDFMYRGEVNVEYGRLSGLLRTAESLKVKGLAETTESSRGEVRGARPSPSILGPASSVTHVDEGDDACRPSPSATSAASPPMANPLPDSPPSPPATTSSGERRSHAARGECSPLGDNSHSPPRSKRSRGRHGSGGSGGSGAGDVRGTSACHREGIESGDPATEEVAAAGVASSPAPSPPAGEPIPGPSGLLLPVQRVPLSLKKEVDWDRASADDKSATGESSSEYRHPHDSDLPGEIVSKPSFLSTNIGDTADDTMEYAEQPERAAFAFNAQQLSSKFPLLNPTSLHPTFSKQIPFSFKSNVPNSAKSPKHPSVLHSVIGKDDRQSTAPEEPSSNQESEPPIEPLLHHFLSSMSNFAYGGPPASPESTPKLFTKEEIDSKNDNASEKDYEDANEEYYKQNSFGIHEGCIDEQSPSGEERAFEGEAREKPFRCDQCGQSYKYGSAYARHREQDHRARPPAEKPFRCEACGMRFRYLKSFKKHRLNHTLDRLRSKNYSSEEMAFEEEGNAMRRSGKDGKGGGSGKERKVVDGREENEKEYEPASVVEENESSRRRWLAPRPEWKEHDAVCLGKSEETAHEETIPTSASTSDASQLWELLLRTSQNVANPRERENENESPLKDGGGRSCLDCPFCGKGFRSRENLRLHVRKHTGERPFECSVCGRAFGGKSDMTRHLRIHTGERPYRCHVCTKRFARADYLSKHLTTHLH